MHNYFKLTEGDNLKNISKILYFGGKVIGRTVTKESVKPPTDYDNQEQIEEILKGYVDPTDCTISYIDCSDSKNEDLIEKYNIEESHTWIVEYNNSEFNPFDNDIPFFKCLENLQSNS